MWSVRSRRNEFSTAVMIHRRDPPCWLGSSPIGRLNFVASTTFSRRPRRASPTTSSESPYASAVATRLIPASSALWMTRIESPGSALPTDVANISAPSAYGLTLMPVRPRVRYCMTGSCRMVETKWKAIPELYGKAVRLGKRRRDGCDGKLAPAARRRATQPRVPAGGREGRLRHVRGGRPGQGDHRPGGGRGGHALPAFPAALGPGPRRAGAGDRRVRRGGPGAVRHQPARGGT